jgi:molecular chaperone GrpE
MTGKGKKKEVNSGQEVIIEDSACNSGGEETCTCTCKENECGYNNENEAVNAQDENINFKEELEKEKKKSKEYFDMLQRKAAEFDNYRKRTNKEKESVYYDAVSEAINEILPVVDNLEKAVETCKDASDSQKILEGMEMILKQFKDSLAKIGVEEIKALGTKFDPDIHDAVMHCTDEKQEESMVIEEFRKGYKVRDRIIRHSMVKVVN